MNSILTTTKKMIGLTEEYEIFDVDIITYINSTFAVLRELGVGPNEGFSIDGPEAVWDDFVAPGPLQSLVRAYMPLKVRLLFDTTMTSGVNEAIKGQISDLEWRINTEVDPEDTYVDL